MENTKKVKENIEINEEKKIKCPLCENTFNRIDMGTGTTDIFLGLDWGMPGWEEYALCPYCGYAALDNPIKDKDILCVLREQRLDR